MAVNGCCLSFSFLSARMAPKVHANVSCRDWRYCHGEISVPYLEGVLAAEFCTIKVGFRHCVVHEYVLKCF